MDELSILEQQNTFYQRLLNSLDQAVVSVDSNGKITFCNRAAETLSGWSNTELIGQSIGRLLPSDALPEEAFKLGALSNSQSDGRTADLQRKDGSTAAVQSIENPIHGADGKLIGFSLRL